MKSLGLPSSNPFRDLPRIRQERRLPYAIPKEQELDRLLEAVGRFDEGASLQERQWRYLIHVVCELLYATGLRISEAAALRPDDLDLEAGLVWVREDKGWRG